MNLYRVQWYQEAGHYIVAPSFAEAVKACTREPIEIELVYRNVVVVGRAEAAKP